MTKDIVNVGYRGYIFSRPFMGERVPQHVQNLVIRDYCLKRGMQYLLSATEYAMDDSFLILHQLTEEIIELDGVVAYSLFQMPSNTNLRRSFFSTIVEAGKDLHFAVEGLCVSDDISIERVENIWKVKETLPSCIVSL